MSSAIVQQRGGVNAEGGKPPSSRDEAVRRLSAAVALLERSQWWTPSDLSEWQMQRVTSVISRAMRSSARYRESLSAAGISDGTAITPESWLRVPLLTRRALQQCQTAITAAGREAGQRRIVTSGSTGEPVVVSSSPRTRFNWYAFTARDHAWHRRDLTQPLAVIRHTRRGMADPPHGAERPGWGNGTAALAPTGPAALLSLAATTEQQVAWLEECRPAYLLTYASNLEALATEFLRRGDRLPELREVRTMGEPVSAQLRALCRDAWGVPLVDMYTAQEVGYIALQCPEREHYHIQSENLLVEIVDDDGRPCKTGQTGRVLVTTLHNFATPLIRYEIGDFAEVGEPCACGRGLPVIKRIAGRQRNMLVMPDGSRRWPSIGQPEDLAHLPPFHQFQIIQRSLERIELKVVPARRITPAEETAARVYLQKMLGHPFEIDFTYVSEIARGPGGKFEDFRSEVAAA